ncbi:MAG: DUF4177 domain-containing protein [Propionibacteriaceae bacterium]|jgi:hypothetical protein|nr:DUF4177 domain-containing protein [Propionibacteriaceae bacterium]
MYEFDFVRVANDKVLSFKMEKLDDIDASRYVGATAAMNARAQAGWEVVSVAVDPSTRTSIDILFRRALR